MSEKRKKYSPAEKAKIALEAIKAELTMSQIISKYSVQAGQVNTWKKQAVAYLPDAFTDKGSKKPQPMKYNWQSFMRKLGG